MGTSRAAYQSAIGAAANTARKTPASMNGPNGMRLLRVATRALISATPATLRAQITNLFDVYAWDVSSNASFRFSDSRRFLLSLAADL